METKFDGTLTDYLIGYVAMCKSVLGKKISEKEQAMVDDLIAVPEERAELVLDRIEMMNTIRDEVILHPELGERLKLCDTALDLPDWWVPGKHDKDLLYGAARHGMSRMEYFVLNDPDLSFRDILKRHLTAETLLDKKAMKEFTERKKTWKIPDEVKEETAAAVEEVKEDVKKEEKSKADEYEFKDEDEEAERPPEKNKKDKRRKSSEKSKASEEESESKDEDSSPKKAKKEKEKEKEKEESPKVEEMREARSRRKSTKDASEATRLAIEAEKMAKEMEKKEKKEKKQDKKKDKEKDKEREKDKAKEEEETKEGEAKNKEDDFEPEQKVVNFPPSSAKAKKEEEEVKAAKKEEESKKEEKPPLPLPKRKVSVSIPPPNITMQQMEQGRYLSCRDILLRGLIFHHSVVFTVLLFPSL